MEIINGIEMDKLVLETQLTLRSLVVVEALEKVSGLRNALGLNMAIVATSGYLQKSSLCADGTLTWKDLPNANAFTEQIALHAGLVDELVIATDDDIAGELIGIQAAEIAALSLGDSVRIRRMRFQSLEPADLRSAFKLAGTKFDADFLAAALVREFACHVDRLAFQRLMPSCVYVSATKRDIVELVDSVAVGSGWQVQADLEDTQGESFVAFIPENTSALAGPKVFSAEAAHAAAKALQGKIISLKTTAVVTQVPGLYPPSTTLRMLAVAADELGIKPWLAQEHLDALYQEGAL